MGRHIASQEPVRVINAVTPEPVDRSQPTPAETQPAAESGHWHGDEWHADPHEPVQEGVEPIGDDTDVSIVDLLRDLPAETLQDVLVKAYVEEHREQYPDCEDHEAVLEDAKRDAEWYLADREHRAKDSELSDELDLLVSESVLLFEKYNYGPIEEATHIPESERLNDTERYKTLLAELDANGERKQALAREKPIYPQPMHTH